MTDLRPWGYDDARHTEFRGLAENGDLPGRVIGHERTALRVMTPAGEAMAVTGARFRRGRGANKPVVGDWLLLRPITGDDRLSVRAILERRTQLSRTSGSKRTSSGGAAGKPGEQLLSSNIDTVILVTGLDQDFSLPRIERYVATIRGGGATPLLLLSKADLVSKEEAAAREEEVRTAIPDLDVRTADLTDAASLQNIRHVLQPGTTTALIGSSGVGKSTLVNLLHDDVVAQTGATREGDGKGRHTTTWRELFLLPEGGVIIDNPGLRATGAIDEESLAAYADLEEIATGCRFSRCSHDTEPGCAIKAAVADGTVSQERVDTWLSLREEADRVKDWLQDSERRQGRRRRR